jgi:hypothetical protein
MFVIIINKRAMMRLIQQIMLYKGYFVRGIS